MLKRFIFLALYAFSWILLFQLFRIVFILYHYEKALEIGGGLLARSFWHGLRMDISFAAYILVIPALLIGFTAKKWSWYQKTLLIYSGFISLVMAVLVVTDLELFRAWGFRIDSTSLHYLKTPKEAFASMGAAPVIPLLLLLLLLFLFTFKILVTVQNRSVAFFASSRFIYTLPAFLLLTGLLVIPIRGGLQQIPMNVSNAFFSEKSFANYAAVNVAWNYASSFINESYNKANPFIFTDEKKAESVISDLYKHNPEHVQLIKSDQKLNVLVIIWESLSAKVVQRLGGAPGVTPNFDALTREGIFFTNMYASGNRSDKGMVAILSGYPAQPTQSIIKIQTKTASLPSLPKVFKNDGYYTSFYYGGETEFANMKSYFLQQGFDRITDKNDFDDKDMNSKWGAHDHVVLGKLLGDLETQKEPFFTTIFTLSSHEPFEVPVPTVIKGDDQEHLFLNAHHYSDASIGSFIKQAKTKSWWQNTLVVIIADHGHPLPEKPAGKPNEFHIPMLWLGGALEKKQISIDSLCSQTDFAATLLNQLKRPSDQFKWSNDIMMHNRIPFAYFAFNNGFGWMKPEGFVVRDNIGGNITEKKGKLPAAQINTGRAYLQASFADYLRR
jgi:phosphoglycerol transferase MdoB-like AlkP superfamily enzyme